MFRYAIFITVLAGSVASAIAALPPAQTAEPLGSNVTVIEKNQAFPFIGPLEVEECLTEDCSELES
jgi:hypothetical protein